MGSGAPGRFIWMPLSNTIGIDARVPNLGLSTQASCERCTIPNCNRPHEAKGYCKPHYKRSRRHHGNLLAGRRSPRGIRRHPLGETWRTMAKRSSARWISCNAPPAATCSSSPPITWPAPIAAMRWSRRSNTPSNLHADLPTNTCHLHGFS